ncbi:MAG TPA: nuclear transport factor 2 family protein [Terrimicrobiaceae bacterium]
MDNPIAGATGEHTEDPVIKANLAAVEAHFHDEGLNEVEKACELYTDDIVWEAPARNLRFVNKQDVVDNYREMFASMKDVEFRNLQRFATHDRVVDDSIVRYKLVGANSVPLPIGSQVEMRLVHIFEMREGKIAKEIAFEMWQAV